MTILKPRFTEEQHVITLLVVGPPPASITHANADDYMTEVNRHFFNSIYDIRTMPFTMVHKGFNCELKIDVEYWEEYLEWLIQQTYPEAYWPGERLSWHHAKMRPTTTDEHLQPTMGKTYNAL